MMIIGACEYALVSRNLTNSNLAPSMPYMTSTE